MRGRYLGTLLYCVSPTSLARLIAVRGHAGSWITWNKTYYFLQTV
jgi:hypothetical protein